MFFSELMKGMNFIMLRLKDLREDHDLKQEEIAKILNISQTNYSKYEVYPEP